MIRKALTAMLVTLSPALAGDIAVVTSQNADKVAIVDLNAGRILSETVVEGGPAPVAYDDQSKIAYVVSAKTGQLTALDDRGRIKWQANLSEGTFGVAIASDGGLFITHWYASKLMRFDAKLTPLWAVPTGKSPAGVAVSPDGTLVATADRDDDRVSIYDAVTGRRLRAVATGKHPYALVFYGGFLWTTDVQSDSVTVIDPISGRVVGRVATGSHPYGIAFAQGRGFVTNQYAGTVTVFDLNGLKVIQTLETGDYPEGIAALPDGSGVAVVHWDSNTLVTIDAQSLEVTSTVDLPDGPRAFGQFTGRQR